MNLQYLFLSVLAVVLIGALFALVVVPILHSWPASYPFPQPRISTSSSPTIRPRDGKLLTEYVSPYGYRFFYPRNYRLAPIFAILLSRTERRDDVVFVTTASKDQESDYVSANRAAGNGGINCSNDIGSRDFLRTGVLIQP